MTPEELREKMLKALFPNHISYTEVAFDMADAAIRVVVECCAEVCEKRSPHGVGKVGRLEEFVSRALAEDIRALLPTIDAKGKT